MTLNEHPHVNARETAREQWDAEIRRLALASIRDDEYREAARQGRIRVLKAIHTGN